MRTKICGNLHNPIEVSALSPEMIGFIFWAISPRSVIGKLAPSQVQALRGPKKIGVFVDETIDQVVTIVKKYGLDGVQLHGDESLEYTEELKSRLSDKILIKVFRVSDKLESDQVNLFSKSADLFLFDKATTNYGGSGSSFDWTSLYDQFFSKPFILAGGIGPESAAQIKILATKQPKLYGVDLNSRFESAPGMKDLVKLNKFLQELNNGV